MSFLRNLIKSPQRYYFIPGVVAALSVAVSVIITVYNRSLSVNFVPLYSTLVTFHPQAYVFGVAAIVIAACLCAATYHTFSYLNSKNRAPLQRLPAKIAVYAAGTAGLAAAALLLGAALYSLADGFWNHCLIELGMFTALFAFFFVTDFLFARLGRRPPQWLIAFNGALIALYLVAFALGYIVLRRRNNTLFSIASIAGYALHIAAFARLGAQYGQLIGATKRK